MNFFLFFCKQGLESVKLISGFRTIPSMCHVNLICSFCGAVLVFVKMFQFYLAIAHHVSYIMILCFLFLNIVLGLCKVITNKYLKYVVCVSVHGIFVLT